LQGPRGGQGERGPTGPAQATIVLTDRGERGPKGETGESALNPELEIAYIDQRGVSEYGTTIEEIKAGSAAGTAIQATSTCPPNRPYLIGGGGYTEPESGQGVVLTASHRAAGETPTWQVQAEATRTTSATVLLFAEAVCAQIKN
jgi:hypothetical protein